MHSGRKPHQMLSCYDRKPSMIRCVPSPDTSLIFTELIKDTLSFTVSAHILAEHKVHKNLKLTLTQHKGMLPLRSPFPFLGISFLLTPFSFLTLAQFGVWGSFVTAIFTYWVLTWLLIWPNIIASTRKAESISKHTKGKTNTFHTKSLVPPYSNSIASNTEQPCNSKETKV